MKICLGEPADAPLVASGTKTERNPDGSATGSHPAFKPHPIQGWTPDFIPQIAEKGITETGYDEFIPIPGQAAIEMSQALAKTQGIFTGISGGASMYAAVEMAKKAPEGSVLVAMLADTGERYLSTPLFASISADMNLVKFFRKETASSFLQCLGCLCSSIFCCLCLETCSIRAARAACQERGGAGHLQVYAQLPALSSKRHLWSFSVISRAPNLECGILRCKF